MIRKIARYKVNESALPAVEQAIRDFIYAIASAEPDTVYVAYRAGDPTSFIHFMAFLDKAAEAYHHSAPHTLDFVEKLYPNCEIQPQFDDLEIIQSSRPFEFT